MVHLYRSNGYNIVLDSDSGSVHVVDDLAYDIIGMYEDTDTDGIIAAMLKQYADDDTIDEAEIRDCVDDIKELAIYVNAAEGTVYYVVNDDYLSGSFDF